MNFKEIKELCKEHNELIEKSKILSNSKKNSTWLKVVGPRGEEFYLSDEEIYELIKIIDNRGQEIEKIMHLCNIH